MSTAQNYLGTYRLIKMIRAGSSCQVWEALKDGQTERVAIKVLLEEHVNKKNYVEQMRNEAIVAADFNHPYVIRVFDYIDRFARPFIVMQLFNARTLKQELRENPEQLAADLPEVIRKCGEGLAYVHDKGYIHCDIKPDNYLVDEQTNVKLIDFSIAQAIKKAGLLGGLRKARVIQGTRSYMAPEQIRGKPLDQRTDIYGFGCVLFELLTGRPPFTGDNPDDLLNRHLRSSIPSVMAFNRSVSKEFSDLLSRMLAKKASDRPESMRDFLRLFSHLNLYRAGMRPRA